MEHPVHGEWRAGSSGATLWASRGGGRHLIPPDGSMDVILRWRADGSILESLIAPPSLGAFSVVLDPRDRYLGLRLPPPLGFLLLGPPGLQGSLASPPWLDALAEAVIGPDPTAPDEAVARALGRALLPRLEGGTPQSRRVARVHGALAAGMEPSEALSLAPWSRRAARRAVAEVAGLSPRFLAKVARMERAGAALAGGASSLAEAALVAGYADQSHMSRAIRALTGETAGRMLPLLAERFKTTGQLAL